MKKKTIAITVVLVLIIAALVIPTFARGGHGGLPGWGHAGRGGFGQHHEMRLEKMFHRLDLTKEQRDQVFAVLDDVRPSMRQMRFAFADHRRDFHRLNPMAADYQTQLQGMADEVSKLAGQMVMTFGSAYAKISALLTEEQRAQVQQMLQKHQGRSGWDSH